MSAVAGANVMREPVWRSAAIALVLLLASILVLYGSTAAAMVAIWDRSGTFAHAFIVPPIALWLIWRQRAELAAQRPRAAPAAIVAAGLLALLWLVGELANANSVTQLALVGLLVLCVPAVAGWRVTRIILFPLGFLFFAVPIGEFMMPRMMVWTADFTVLALRLTGIPVYREAQQIVIPSGTWSVVEACSGIRYLMASVMVGTLFAYLNYRTLSRRLAFVGVSILVPIVANWVRAYLIVLVGHLSGNRLAVGADHIIYGWVFFGLVVMLMFAIGARWTQPALPPAATSHPAASAAPHARAAGHWLAAGAVALLVLLPHLALHALALPEAPSPVTLAGLVAPRDGWHEAERRVADFHPAFSGADADFAASYVAAGGRAVGVYVGYYSHQDAERKLVSSENVVVRSLDPHWLRKADGRRELEVGGRSVAFATTQLRPHTADPGLERGLAVWQVYWIDGHLTSSDVVAKLLIAWERLLGRGDDAAVLMFYGPEARDVEDFARAHLGGIEAALERVRSGSRNEVTRKEARR